MLVKVWQARLVREDRRAGVVAAVIANIVGSDAEPADFFPSIPRTRSRQMSAEEIDAALGVWLGVAGGAS